MTTTYTKSLATDFGSSLKPHQFHKEIEDNTGITPNLIGINITDDVVDIVFDSALSGGEQTILNGLISSHAPVTAKNRFYNIPIETTNIRDTTYVLMAKIPYQGSDVLGTIDYIEVVTKVNKNNATYDLRVINPNNEDVLAEISNQSNQQYVSIDMGTVSNVPENEILLELQGRVSGNGTPRLYIQMITVYHGNV